MNTTNDPYDFRNFKAIGHEIIEMLGDYLDQACSGRMSTVLPKAGPDEMLERWNAPIGDAPSAEPLSLLQSIIDQSHHLHHPHYVGHQVSSPLPLASLSELVGSLLNNGSAVYEMGPVNTIMEKRCIEWLSSKIGFDSSSDGVFTSGGTLGNLTALLAARQAKAGYDIWKNGVESEKKLTILISGMCHYSVSRAASVMGLGQDAVIGIPVDSSYKMSMEGLAACWQRCVDEGRTVIALVANGCSTATGTFDPISAIADFCERHSIWLHVDGAHGATAVLSDTYRHLLDGVERADSIVWDMHKMMLMPALVTAVLFRNKAHSYDSLSQQASYLFEQSAREEWYNYAQRTMECTKLMMGLRIYVPLMCYGAAYFADYYTSRVDLTREFAAMLRRTGEFDVPVEPETNIICFRFSNSRHGTDLNGLQKKIRREILESERFYLVQTLLGKELYLRCTIMNPLTTKEHLSDLIEEILRIGKAQ